MIKLRLFTSFPALILALFLISNSSSIAKENNARIIGGNLSELGQFPSAATFARGDLPGVCTGVIISPKWLLTAASCIANDVPKDLRILAGTTNLNGPEGTSAFISRFVIHHEFNFDTLTNNLALVRLYDDLEFSANIQEIGIAPVQVNSSCTIVGWGAYKNGWYDGFQRYAEDILVLERDECELQLGQELDEDSEFCAYGGKARGACDGDVGSPLICNGKVVGIVSYGIDSCESDKPQVYVDISKFARWIWENTGIVV